MQCAKNASRARRIKTHIREGQDAVKFCLCIGKTKGAKVVISDDSNLVSGVIKDMHCGCRYRMIVIDNRAVFWL
ncbi:hypothetical protein [uncultured Gimesia sp.]|uniref:hypothetical protein n=1 Tax=uncultured Gimesia sp. TaxID=1678688 RepID=UPI00260435B2|nr:hypothetical protein [uncultured Gimesia sp.]